jgi:hypothetical protein
LLFPAYHINEYSAISQNTFATFTTLYFQNGVNVSPQIHTAFAYALVPIGLNPCYTDTLVHLTDSTALIYATNYNKYNGGGNGNYGAKSIRKVSTFNLQNFSNPTDSDISYVITQQSQPKRCKWNRTIDLSLLFLPSLRRYRELGSLECLEPITVHLSQRMESHVCEVCELITDLGFPYMAGGSGWGRA